MGRAERITEVIKAYDSKLFCKSEDGKLCIYRKSQRIESYDLNGTLYHFVRPSCFWILSLTHNWRMDGDPADWGIEPIMKKLKMGDLWHRDLASEVIRQEEKHLESTQRHLDNESEAFLKDYRRKFARTFNDVRVANMAKKDSRNNNRIKEI